MAKWTKPTVETKFHIDFDWWEETGRNFRVHLFSHLCKGCQERYRNYQETETIDWIDPNTAEVTQVDGLWHSLRTDCSVKPEYVNASTPLTTAVFRVFLANGNEPLSSVELSSRLRRSPDVILRTITGVQTYGIKPITGDSRRGPRPKIQTS